MSGRIIPFPQPAILPSGPATRGFSRTLTTTTGQKTSSNLGTGVEPSSMDMAARASDAGLGCIRGATLMLTFEAGTAAVIYALWLLLHQIR